MCSKNGRAPAAALGYAVERIVDGSGFHTANGVAFGPDGRLYAASVLGESIFALDLATGAIETVVGPFAGESDDLVFTQAGDLIWTALLEGAVRMRTADGRMRDLATGLDGANSIALTRDANACSSARSSWARGYGRSTWPAWRRRGWWPSTPAG